VPVHVGLPEGGLPGSDPTLTGTKKVQPATQGSILNHGMELDSITAEMVQTLKNMGIIFPIQIKDENIIQFPLDITAVSLLELGELHSYWCAMYARDSGIHGMVVAMKRSVKYKISKIKPSAKDGNPAQVKLMELEAQFAQIDAMDSILAGVAEGHKRYADAVSREMTRRSVEASLSR